jgi:hypothetical protein
VVEYDHLLHRGLAAHPVGARYRYLFGDVDWHSRGFAEWLDSGPRLV